MDRGVRRRTVVVTVEHLAHRSPWIRPQGFPARRAESLRER